MPIWSLTKERVEKLSKQIGDKEVEIDTLIKLSKEDLWKRDLEEFINEWRFQLEDEDKRQKKVASLGRRESRKLKIGAAKGGRKRKQNDDSDEADFGGPAKKPAVAKHLQPRQGLLSHLSPLAKANQPKPKAPKVPKAPKATTDAKKESAKPTEAARPKKEALEDIWINLDDPLQAGSDPPVAPVFSKAKAAAAATKKAAPRKIVESDDDSEEAIVKPTAASRKPRAAATKPVKYSLQSDSDDSNGDDLLFDVGKMVKGIGNPSADQSSSSRPLFSASMSRPGSSAGLPKKPSSAKPAMDLDGDDTDYSKLVPAKKGSTTTANATIFSNDDQDVDMDDDDLNAPPPKKFAPAAKTKDAPGPKQKPKPAAKPKAAPALQKKLELSPAAKAYAKKQERNKRVVVSEDEDEEDEGDEIEKVANETLEDDDDDGEAEVVAARPSRRAAAATKKAWVLDDDSEEEASEVDEGETGSFAEDESD